MALRLSAPDSDAEREEKKAELTEHLAELRTRLIRSVLYCVVGMIVMYVFAVPIYRFLSLPITEALARSHAQVADPTAPQGQFLIKNITDPFFIILQITMVGGLVLAAPLVVLELWGFVAPALTPSEKRGVYFVAPMSVILFALGVCCAYLVLPMALHWFLGFLPIFPGAILLQDPLPYVVLVVKMLLVFGLIFQLPVVLMFLGKIGILTSALMIRYWRQIAVGLFTVAMVVAPSNDPGTMLALAIPLTVLFFASIWLVKLVEPKDASA